jgi:hypothetical protein
MGGRVQFSISIREACLICLLAQAAYGQDADRTSDANPPETVSKRIFGIIPNYRSSPSLAHYQPLTAKAKFKIAAKDSFDPGAFILAALIAGPEQLSHSTPAFGQGAAGFARYFSTTYGNMAIGNFMREAIYPSLLHQDPRYFRRGTGSAWSRAGYAISQIFWTHTDRGGSQFNFSEVLGSATAAAISDAYYPGRRTVANAASKLGIQLGVGTAGNFLKEFWPDLERKFSHKGRSAQSPSGN